MKPQWLPYHRKRADWLEENLLDTAEFLGSGFDLKVQQINLIETTSQDFDSPTVGGWSQNAFFPEKLITHRVRPSAW